MTGSKEELRYLRELEPAYLDALQDALNIEDTTEVARLETALSDLYESRRIRGPRMIYGLGNSPSPTSVMYDPSRPLLSQAVELVHPALVISPEIMAKENRELEELKQHVLEIEADELRH